MNRSVTSSKSLTSYAVGDMIEYKPFDWFPTRLLLVSKATFYHETFSTGAYWALEMVDTKTGDVIKEQGHRVKKISE